MYTILIIILYTTLTVIEIYYFYTTLTTLTLVETVMCLFLTVGETKMIGKEELFLQKDGTHDFLFTVTEGAKHGALQLIEPDTGRVTSRNASSFTSSDIIDMKV